MTRDEIKRVVGYIRVSTAEQGRSGLGLEAQQAAIAAACAYRGWQLVSTYRDVQSGKAINGRHELRHALDDLAGRRADALVVAKLDRLSRSMKDFVDLLETSRRQRWALVCLDVDMDTSTAMGEAMAQLAMTFAQLERRRIGERTSAALQAKKDRGEPVGRERLISHDLEARIVRMRRRGWSFQRIAEKLTTDGVPTPSGGAAWSWTTVARVVRRHVDEPVQRRSRRVDLD